MKFGKTPRQESALERRKQDVEKYKLLLLEEVPQSLYGNTYSIQKEWHDIITRKLKKARADVAILTEKLDRLSV